HAQRRMHHTSVVHWLRGCSLCRFEVGGGIVRARALERAAAGVPRKALCLEPQRAEKGFVGSWRPQELALLGVLRAESFDLAHVAEWKSPPQRDDGGRPA